MGKAARNAVEKAVIHRKDLRIAEAVEFDRRSRAAERPYRPRYISYMYHEMYDLTARLRAPATRAEARERLPRRRLEVQETAPPPAHATVPQGGRAHAHGGRTRSTAGDASCRTRTVLAAPLLC